MEGNNNGSADSYIGSLISLTSKSEMRYEGVLYNINTLQSSIGLRNVRSFGTEGRKKDGPQVPPSDKVYEYILFRGSDIKDLQVKSSPPAPPAPTSQPMNNDPAIIQSHYPRPPSTPPSFQSTASGPPSDLGSQTAQLGHPVANFQGGLPLYQPGANVGPWGPSPPPPNVTGGGLPMPMYWQGYNFPPNGLPQLPQQSLLRPPHGLPMPPLQQPIQYPGFNSSLSTGTSSLPGSNLPEIPSSLLSTTGSLNLAPTSSSALPPYSNLPTMPSIALGSETLSGSIPNKPSMSTLSPPPLSGNLPELSPLTSKSTDVNTVGLQISNKPNETSIPTFPYSSVSQPISSAGGGSSASLMDTPTPSLVTPGQLLNSTPAVISTQPPKPAHKDVEVVEVSSTSVVPSVPVAVEAQPPLLPLPQSSRGAPHKPNGAPYQGRPAYRGRGRGAGFSRPVTKFTEDFDFTAMNEKFNKDEVWGHLGKSGRAPNEGHEGSDEDYYEDEDYSETKVEAKPVYNKDDFFDSISSNALDRESNNGRIRFSEQRKIDTETFGDFSRYRGGRSGHWHGRGGRYQYRGAYRGRGYGGGYAGRGGGRGMSTRDF